MHLMNASGDIIAGKWRKLVKIKFRTNKVDETNRKVGQSDQKVEEIKSFEP
jgi:hypothetical protein